MIHLVSLNPSLDFEFTLENPKHGKIGSLSRFDLQAGGKALNLIRFLNPWGVQVKTWLGTGGGEEPTEILYRNLIKKEGLRVRFLNKGTPVRINVVLSEKNKLGKYNHAGFKLEDSILKPAQNEMKPNDFAVLTGRLPEGMNPKWMKSTIEVLNKKRVRVMVDSSGEALKYALMARPWFFKVNLFELSEALGKSFKDLNQIQGLIQKQFSKQGLTHGAVTHGSEGAILWKNNEIYQMDVFEKFKPSLVVGAGDGFLAGYIKGIQMGLEVQGAARLACAAGTVVALLGIRGFEPKQVTPWLNKVQIRRIL